MPFRPGCHRPFHRSACICSLLLLSQDCVLFSFGSVSLLLLSTTLCFSMFSLQPSSLSDPSPCIYPAGAYCFLGAGVGFEPTMSYASLQPSLVAYTVAFDHSANPPEVLHFSLNSILTTSYRRIIHRLCSSLSDSEDTPTASFSSFRRGVSAWLASSVGCRRILPTSRE